MVSGSEDGSCMGGDLGPQLRSLLGDGSGDGAALGFTLVVDDDSSIILAVEEGAIGSPPGASLADDDSGVDFLPELLDTLLDRGEHDVTDGSSRESVETASHALHGNDEEVFGSGVVSAVEGGCHWEATSNSELDTDCTCFGLFGHRLIY
jgi:hypothetical protein